MATTSYPRVGIGILVFDEQQRLLLGKRKGSHGHGSWCNPGGHLEFGETIMQGATREVLEETGLVIVNPTFVGITNDIFVAENKHYVSIFLKALCPAGQVPQLCEPEKTVLWQWFAIDNLPSPLFVSLKNLLENYGTDWLHRTSES